MLKNLSIRRKAQLLKRKLSKNFIRRASLSHAVGNRRFQHHLSIFHIQRKAIRIQCF